MKIAVMGAGAVGCYYGALLARAGHEVVLIGRAAHAGTITREGLRLERAEGSTQVPLAASTEAAAAAGAELVLCCVKSPDTDRAARELRPHLAAGTRVLSLQNGVDNAQRLQAALPGVRVAPTVVYVAVEMAGPGHVRHKGGGTLVVAPDALPPALLEILRAAGITVRCEDVNLALWTKLVLNCAWNAPSAITQMSYGEIWPHAAAQTLMRAVAAECHAVAAAEGVALPADLWPAIAGLAKTMPGQLSSTAQDLARARPSEIEHLNGYIVRTGARHGLATPANQALTALVHLLEARAAR
ncbi:MAG: 2-dehydropantoate 2-reductase [Candidatus Dactylopiibacterium sp.]|nr:2-dehydropantoate 2-reductase [Candidatus Dactylopiibacterium sp.]